MPEYARSKGSVYHTRVGEWMEIEWSGRRRVCSQFVMYRYPLHRHAERHGVQCQPARSLPSHSSSFYVLSSMYTGVHDVIIRFLLPTFNCCRVYVSLRALGRAAFSIFRQNGKRLSARRTTLHSVRPRPTWGYMCTSFGVADASIIPTVAHTERPSCAGDAFMGLLCLVFGPYVLIPDFDPTLQAFASVFFFPFAFFPFFRSLFFSAPMPALHASAYRV